MASSQLFPFTAVGTPDALTPASFSLTGGGAPQLYTDIPAGNAVTLTETVPTAAPNRWTLRDIECDGATSPTYNLNQAKADFTIAAGQDVDCTYTDTKVPTATVQIVKAARACRWYGVRLHRLRVPDGGVLPADQAFTLAPDGDIACEDPDGASQQGGEISPSRSPHRYPRTGPSATSSVSTAEPRWATPAFTATGGLIDVTINPGDTITCTFIDT